jgi:hypothetical protein
MALGLLIQIQDHSLTAIKGGQRDLLQHGMVMDQFDYLIV